MARAFRQTNLTVIEYCRQAGISQSAFFRRRKQLDPTWRRQKRARLIAKNDAPASSRKSPFVPVTVSPVTTAEIELPSGIRIRVPATDRQALTTAIVAAMGAREEQA